MARFTSIGMPRKTFVASAAEEAGPPPPQEDYHAGPSTSAGVEGNDGDVAVKKKRKRSKNGKGVEGSDSQPGVVVDDTSKGMEAASAGFQPPVEVSKGWGRDENIAKKARHNAERTDNRRVVRQVTKHTSTTCFACRSVGHAARDCPNVLLAASGGGGSASMLENESGNGKKKEGMKRKKGKMGGEVTGGKCYRCDSTEHSLSACPEPVDSKNPTPYATCFICLGTGHLSSLCPQNPGRGIYVNGGSCKVCGSVAHRAKDCPDDKRGSKESAPINDESGNGNLNNLLRKKNDLLLGVGSGAGADEDDFIIERRRNLANAAALARENEKAKLLKGGGGGGSGTKGKRAKHEPAKNSLRGPAKPITPSAMIAGEVIVPGPSDLKSQVVESVHGNENSDSGKVDSAALVSSMAAAAAAVVRKPLLNHNGPKPKGKIVKF